MIKHVVLLNWKSGVTKQQIADLGEGFKRLSQEVGEIKSYEFGPDAGFYKGNASYALVAEFANAADLNAYVNHPKHQALLAELAGPMLESFQAVQFEMH